MKANEVEPILEGILQHCEPADVIVALRNVLYHNEDMFGNYDDSMMKSLNDNLIEAATNAETLLHG